MEKGFFASLFDVSFESLITPRIVRGLYAIILALVSMGTLGTLIAAVASDRSPGSRLATFVFVPLAWLLYVVITRVAVELVVAVFRILEATQRS